MYRSEVGALNQTLVMASTATQRPSRAKSPVPTGDGDKKKTTNGEEGEKKVAAPWRPGKLSAIAVVICIVLFALYKQFGHHVNVKEGLEKAVHFVEAQGRTAVIWYCAFTLIGVVLLIPTTPMEIAGGFLFSPSYGMWTVLVFTGTAKLIANSISVLIARYVVKDWVVKNVVAKNELLTMVSKAVKEEPWKMAFLVRGSMVPLFVKNYGLGVMDIGFLPIAACSSIFTNFYAFQNIYMGSAMQDIKEIFAPKVAVAVATEWTQEYVLSTAKKMMPIFFNIGLVIFLVKAVKAQIKKQKAAIEGNLKDKDTKDKPADKKAD